MVQKQHGVLNQIQNLIQLKLKANQISSIMGSLGNTDLRSFKGSVAPECNADDKGLEMDVGLIQRKPVGAILGTPEPDTIPKLFTPFQIRGKTFQNRILVSPMCMYSCEKQDGVMTDFHLAHYGNLALRGPSVVFTEAASVEPRGRLSPQDAGIWGEEHVEPLRRVAKLVQAAGSKLGIQLAHGGRKSGTYPPYHKYEENMGRLSRDAWVPDSEGGFAAQIVAPSPIPWKEGLPAPNELSTQEVTEIVQNFANAAKLSAEAGVDIIEIHGAHGYLLHEFLSGNTNKRTDEYGGSQENRLRLVLEIIRAVRAVIPTDMPLFLRVSGTDYASGDILSPDPDGWDIQQVIELCRRAVPLGLDVIDISSGGNISKARFGPIMSNFGFQVPLAEEVKKAKIEGLIVGTVGGMNDGKLSEQVLREGKADITFVGREFIKDPSFVHTAARELEITARWASQYSWMWPLEFKH